MGTESNGSVWGNLARKIGFKVRDKPQRRAPSAVSAASEIATLMNGYGAQELRNSESICSAVTRLANALACMPVHLYRDYKIQHGHPF